MARKFDRRNHDRFTVPGAAVSWSHGSRESLPDETWPLSDISKGGLSFLTNDPPAVGLEISLLVFLPATTQTLELAGTVVYSIPRGPRLTYGYRVGVEWKPFAQSDGGNPIESLEVIETLRRTYGKRKRK